MTINQHNASQYAEVLRWLAEDGVVERIAHYSGCRVAVDMSVIDPQYPPEDYRRKPKLSLRPWKPEEVPVGAVVRSKGGVARTVIVRQYSNSWATDEGVLPLSSFDGCEWKWPQEPDTAWRPCGVEVAP